MNKTIVSLIFGIIIAGRYDKKLDYALEYAPNDTEVFIYNVSFTLNEFKK